jgi:hypothetical protein
LAHSPDGGEPDEPKKTALAQASEDAMVVDTMGGRVHVRWDEKAQATPHGQIVFFAEFLATAGVFDRWVEDCALRYSSPNASRPRDVLGTLMLGILAGSKRYAHIAGVRGDAVAAKALGLKAISKLPREAAAELPAAGRAAHANRRELRTSCVAMQPMATCSNRITWAVSSLSSAAAEGGPLECEGTSHLRATASMRQDWWSLKSSILSL